MNDEEILDLLRRGAPEPPPVHWGAYRAELTRRIEERGAPSQGWGRRPWTLAGAAVAAVALGFLLTLELRPPVEPPLAMTDELLAARHLDLLGHIRVIERLELWEDLEAVQLLDAIPDRPPARS